mmetsp:Transcript_4652/g.8919  ORF Transcript_4652/g.8919 Transcript_4652/m.8919 type:complete len:275 (-) Transcript_4652:1953-2777(-)
MFTVLRSNLSKPKAVVILYGWLGSTSRHVRKYAEIYLENGCYVVYGTANSMDVMFRIQSRLSEFAMESVRETAKIIKEQEALGSQSLPVSLHYFSNGGAFVVETLSLMAQQRQHQDMLSSSDKDDLILVADRLHNFGFEICDSAPAYLHPTSGLAAINRGVPNVWIRIVFKAAFRVALLLNSLNTRHEREAFWENVINSKLCKHQVFIYSAKDDLTDHTMIDELITIRKDRGINVRSCKFDDSEHVQHFRKYPVEYRKAVIEAIDGLANAFVQY